MVINGIMLVPWAQTLIFIVQILKLFDIFHEFNGIFYNFQFFKSPTLTENRKKFQKNNEKYQSVDPNHLHWVIQYLL